MSPYGKLIVPSYPLFPVEGLGSLKEAIKALCLKFSQIQIKPLCKSKADIAYGRGFPISLKGDAPVHRFASLITEAVYLSAEKPLKTEKAGCCVFHLR